MVVVYLIIDRTEFVTGGGHLVAMEKESLSSV